jgi:acyl-CoA thioester hydrolase
MKKDLVSYHRVMSYELDSWGHVNNAVYLNYLEKARNDFMTQKGLNFKKFDEWNVFPVLSKAEIEFKSPAFADDDIIIYGYVSKHSTASFTLTYSIVKKGNEQLVAKAETSHIFVNKNNRPSRIPEEFKKKFIDE